MPKITTFGISDRFQSLFPSIGQVTYVLLTLPPLSRSRSLYSVRLACLIHAVSVQSEPRSNSQREFIINFELFGEQVINLLHSSRIQIKVGFAFCLCIAVKICNFLELLLSSSALLFLLLSFFRI